MFSWFLDLYIFIFAAMLALKRKYNIPVTILSGIAVWYICLFPLHFDIEASWVKSTLVVIYLVWPLIMFKDNFVKKFIFGVIGLLLGMLADMTLCAILFNMFGAEYLDPTRIDLRMYFGLIDALYSGIYVIIWNKLVNKKNIISARLLLFAAFTVVQIGFALSFIFVLFMIWDMIPISMQACLGTLVVVFLILSIALEVVIYYSTKRAQRFQKLQSDYDALEYQNKLQTEYYEKMQENIDATAKIRHDINNIVNIIKIQLAANTEESKRRAAELTNEINEIMRSTSARKYCDNRIINTVLFDKGNTAESDGIKICDEVILDETLSIENFDLCRIFVNLLDNAIKALKGYTENKNKTIFISCKESDGFLYIKTDNPYFENNNGDDKSKEGGYGLRIIEDIAKKYEGALITKRADGRFKTIVTLKLQ